MIKRTLCFSNPAALSLRLGQLVINRQSAESEIARETTRPIEDIGVLIIESQCVTLTSALIAFLAENNVAVIFCDSKHLPTNILLPLAGNNSHTEKFWAQIESSRPLRKQLWQQTVVAKIVNQAKALKIVSPHSEIGCMEKWATKVKSGDSSNLEGRAAVYYWKYFFSEFNDSFIRDQDGDGINILLNYGYAILRAVIARALVSSGLNLTMGIFHKNKYNPLCLADDIMEPYRPYVDMLVHKIARDTTGPLTLSKDIKRQLLSIPVIDVVIESKRSPLMIAASMTTASLARCFLGESRKISYPMIET